MNSVLFDGTLMGIGSSDRKIRKCLEVESSEFSDDLDAIVRIVKHSLNRITEELVGAEPKFKIFNYTPYIDSTTERCIVRLPRDYCHEGHLQPPALRENLGSAVAYSPTPLRPRIEFPLKLPQGSLTMYLKVAVLEKESS